MSLSAEQREQREQAINAIDDDERAVILAENELKIAVHDAVVAVKRASAEDLSFVVAEQMVVISKAGTAVSEARLQVERAKRRLKAMEKDFGIGGNKATDQVPDYLRRILEDLGIDPDHVIVAKPTYGSTFRPGDPEAMSRVNLGGLGFGTYGTALGKDHVFAGIADDDSLLQRLAGGMGGSFRSARREYGPQG